MKVFKDLHIPHTACRAGINEKLIRDDDPKKLTTKLAEAKLEVRVQLKINNEGYFS